MKKQKFRDMTGIKPESQKILMGHFTKLGHTPERSNIYIETIRALKSVTNCWVKEINDRGHGNDIVSRYFAAYMPPVGDGILMYVNENTIPDDLRYFRSLVLFMETADGVDGFHAVSEACAAIRKA